MKNLILLYRKVNNNSEVTIREFPQVKENNDHYLLGEGNWGKLGVLKKKIGIICKRTMFSNSDAARFPIDLPDMYVSGWDDIYFVFLNKNIYDRDPVYYYNMIKNYKV